MTTQHRPVSVTRAGQGASATVAYGRDDWRDEAACREGVLRRSPEVFFPDNFGPHHDAWAEAREVCAGCPVVAACLKVATDAESGISRARRFGFYGGKTPVERFEADGRARAAEKHQRQEVAA